MIILIIEITHDCNTNRSDVYILQSHPATQKNSENVDNRKRLFLAVYKVVHECTEITDNVRKYEEGLRRRVQNSTRGEAPQVVTRYTLF